jgi:hypothetical protein
VGKIGKFRKFEKIKKKSKVHQREHSHVASSYLANIWPLGKGPELAAAKG